MSLNFARLSKFASLLAFLAACGANEAGSHNRGGPRDQGNDSHHGPGDGPGPSDGPGLGEDPGGGFQDIDDDAACATHSAASDALPTSVMFQIDTSGSMNCYPDESESQCTPTQTKPGSRWELLKPALIDALDAIPPQTIVGIMHYPTLANTPFSCDPSALIGGVQPAPLTPNHKNALKAQINLLRPLGGTPTHEAMAKALDQLKKLPIGKKYIVLATDGAANFCLGCIESTMPGCNMAADTEQMIKSVGDILKSQNISTFVIGVPGSEPFRTELSRMAKAGGTARAGCGADDCHYDMTKNPEKFGALISEVLGEISGQLLGCTYPIPTQDGTFDSNRVNVRLTEGDTTTNIPRDKNRQDGWDYSGGGKDIELFGPACDKAKATKQGRIDILFGCPTVVK